MHGTLQQRANLRISDRTIENVTLSNIESILEKELGNLK
jgi:hypothetical protein